MARIAQTVSTLLALMNLIPTDRAYAESLLSTLLNGAEADGRREAQEAQKSQLPPQGLTASDFVNLIIFARTNQKIQAIKTIRTALGLGLKEAKHLCDEAWNRSPAVAPSRPSQPPSW